MVRVRKAIGVCKMRIFGTDGGGLFIHHFNEAVIGAAHCFRCGHSGIIAGNKHHAVEHLMQGQRHVRADSQVCAVLLHGPLSNHCVLIQFVLPLFQSDDTGQNLGGTGRIHLQGTFFLCQEFSRITVHQGRRYGSRFRRSRQLRFPGRLRGNESQNAESHACKYNRQNKESQ